MVALIMSLVALGIGAAIGIMLQRRQSRAHLQEAQTHADRVKREARRSVELAAREAEAHAKEDVLEVQRLAHAEQQAIEEHCERLRVRVERIEQRCGQYESRLQKREAQLDEGQQEIRRLRNEANDFRRRAKAERRQVRSVLEKAADTTAADVAAKMVETMVAEARSRSADQLRNLEANSGEELTRTAKRAMGIAMQRYTGHCPRDRGIATLTLASASADLLRKEAGSDFLRTLEAATEVSLTLSDSGDSLRMDTGDGIAREVCRRVITKYVNKQGKIDSLSELLDTTRQQLGREVVELGKGAFKQLKLKRSGDDVVELVGRLNWRTSYTQNQYRHAIEAATLAGLIADELGLDPVIARRGALLHDIGKAMTHNTEGSHALNGAEVAERCGEDARVVNAIGAHHNEVPMESPYAYLAAATDAMSGGRPGARREVAESYGDRIGDLERVASRFRGVDNVHAVQAGRELRVLVNETQVSDGDLEALSADIAAKISEELTFPGQIRVTVIREFRSVAVAS
jgi:ribonuclease Y